MKWGKILVGPGKGGVDLKAANMMATVGFSDFAALNISGSESDDIDLAALYGTNKLFRSLKSTSATGGVVYVKTMYNHSNGYVAYPLAAGEKDLLLAPITHIRKSGSISGVIVFWQEIG